MDFLLTAFSFRKQKCVCVSGISLMIRKAINFDKQSNARLKKVNDVTRARVPSKRITRVRVHARITRVPNWLNVCGILRRSFFMVFYQVTGRKD